MRRHYHRKKPVAENYLRIDVYGLNKRGFFREEETEGWCSWYNSDGEETARFYTEVSTVEDEMYAKFAYLSPELSFSENWDFQYEIRLTTTLCNFGNVRYWFLCPSCYRRVGVLYKDIYAEHLVCRRCNNLTYRSRNESHYSGGSNTYKRIAKLSRQIEALERRTKRRFYDGRPTKKRQRLYRLRRSLEKCLRLAVYNRKT